MTHSHANTHTHKHTKRRATKQRLVPQREASVYLHRYQNTLSVLTALLPVASELWRLSSGTNVTSSPAEKCHCSHGSQVQTAAMWQSCTVKKKTCIMQPPCLILWWNGNLTGSRQIKILAAVKENKDAKTHFHIFIFHSRLQWSNLARLSF